MPQHVRRRPLVVRLAVLAGTAMGAAALTLAGVGSASAADPQTVFVNEGFTGSTVPAGGYLKPAAPNGTNAACLTAGTSTSASPLPGCDLTPPDADGSGALRLTAALNGQVGGVGSTQSVPISKGLDAVFTSYQYGGNGADGISFYLAATDPYDPHVPANLGQLGGSLGYSALGAQPGLSNGYLGLGLDAFGNWINSDFEGSGCSTAQPGTQNTNVSVRGPGNGSQGYCLLSSDATLTKPTSLEGTTRADSAVPVEVVINPAATAATSAGSASLTSINVPAHSYAIVYKPLDSATQKSLVGTLPNLTDPQYSGIIPASWVDPATGYPYKLSFGWAASTGGSTDVHEINQLDAQTVNGPVPVLSSTASGSSSVTHGAAGSYTVTTSASASGGSEDQPIRATTTFPAGITPTAYAGTDWTCAITGQTETCSYAGTVAPGASAPVLTLPFSATGDASTTARSISTVVSSTDAESETISSDVTITPAPTTITATATPSPAAFGSAVALTASGLPSDATGTVTFSDADSGATLCTAPVSAGSASCSAAAPGPAGARTVSAAYGGATNYSASTATAALTVTKATPSASTVSVAPGSIAYGATATLAVAGLPADAAGTVAFATADGTALCTATLPATSCLTSTTLPGGDYTGITARYSGDVDYTTSTSGNAVELMVVAPATAVTVTADPDAITYGDSTTLTAGGLPADATGTVTFSTQDGTMLCTVTLPALACSTTALDPRDTAVTARYSGDGAHAFSTASTPVSVSPTRTSTVSTPTASPGTTSFTATWRAVPGAVGYRLLVSRSFDFSDPIEGFDDRAVGDVITYAVDGLAPGTTYYYRVVAVSADGTVLGIQEAAATTSAVPAVAAALARTGSTVAIAASVAIGCGLLAGGVVLLLAARRRRREV